MTATLGIIRKQRRSITLNIVGLTILFVGYVLTTGTGMSESDGLKNIFRFSSLLVLISNMIIEGAIKKKFFLAIILLLCFALLSQSPIAVNIAVIIVIAASLNRLSTKEFSIAILVPVVVIVILHAFIFFTGNVSIETTNIGDRTRTSLGFSNANQISLLYFSLVVVSVYLHTELRRKLSLLIMMTAFLVAILIFLETDSRTSLFGMALLFLVVIFNKYILGCRARMQILRYVGFFTPFFCVVATIIITNSDNSELNILLSLRPYLFSEFIGDASLLDIVFGWSNQKNPGVDNFFLMILSAVGIGGLAVIILFISIQTYNMRLHFIPIIVVLMIMSIFESFLIRPEIPASALFAIALFSPSTQARRAPGKKR